MNILEALRFDAPALTPAGLDLDFADRNQLTPLLSRFDLPPSARSHVDAVLARNALRAARISTAYAEIAPLFDHVLLKGETHIPDFVGDPRLRVQYDLDLYVPPGQQERARGALLSLGYEPIGRMEKLAMDHLPAMVRKTGWQWRGDYFDPDLPPAVEVHFRFWDEATERLKAEGVENFWKRREGSRLALVDRLGYAALHLTRHLLRGNLRPLHVWELGRFLHTHDDPAFWRSWRGHHSPSLRRLEAVAFLLAHSWFACALPDEPREAVAQLPPAVHRWFDLHRWSPILGNNKDELWLHLSLLESRGARIAVLRRRLIPASLPGPVDAIHLPAGQMTLLRRLQSLARNSAYAAGRALHHARLFVPTLASGVKWWLEKSR